MVILKCGDKSRVEIKGIEAIRYECLDEYCLLKKLEDTKRNIVCKLGEETMGFIELLINKNSEKPEYKKDKSVRIMIFTEGTILGPQIIFQHFSHSAYKPIKNSVNKVKSWKEQGAEIVYLTSRKKIRHVHEIKELLSKNHFPGEGLYYREKGQKYKDIVEFVVPDILIEDNCRSIGGKWQMCITYVKPEVKTKVNQ